MSSGNRPQQQHPHRQQHAVATRGQAHQGACAHQGPHRGASSEVAAALLSGTDPEDVLSLIATQALQVTRGALAIVALPTGDGRLLVEVAEGDGAEGHRGRILDRGGLLDEVISADEARHISADVLTPMTSDGDGLAVPLGGSSGQRRGVLIVTGLPDADTAVAVRALTSFAGQAAVALELAERRRQAERFAIFEDRDGIARDLHDLVIQRLFATGMQLEGASRLITDHPDEAQTRVRHAVDELDITIRELRSTIYGLQVPVDTRTSLRALLLQVVDSGAEQLGFAPSLRMDGPLDTLVASVSADHLLAAAREALSNAARHAEATAVTVTVTVRDEEVVLDVLDNGIGMPAGGRRSGLANLAARAAQLGGTLELAPSRGGGTQLTWRAPLVAQQV